MTDAYEERLYVERIQKENSPERFSPDTKLALQIAVELATGLPRAKARQLMAETLKETHEEMKKRSMSDGCYESADAFREELMRTAVANAQEKAHGMQAEEKLRGNDGRGGR